MGSLWRTTQPSKTAAAAMSIPIRLACCKGVTRVGPFRTRGSSSWRRGLTLGGQRRDFVRSPPPCLYRRRAIAASAVCVSGICAVVNFNLQLIGRPPPPVAARPARRSPIKSRMTWQ